MNFAQHITYGSQVPPLYIRKINNVRQKTFVWEIDENTVAYCELGGKLAINIGVSIVHPEDEFVKATGLRVARSRLSTEMFEVITVLFAKRPDGVKIVKMRAEGNLEIDRKKEKVVVKIEIDLDTKKIRSSIEDFIF